MTTTAAALLALNPVAAYLFDETSGTTLVDATANGRNGTYTATGVTLGQPGLTPDSAGAALFDGVDGFASVAYDAAWMAPTTFSVAVTAQVESGFGYATLVAITDMFEVNLNETSTTGANARFSLKTSGSAGTYVRASSAADSVTDGQPVRLVATYDGATMALYQDAALVASAAVTGTPVAGAGLFLSAWNGSSYPSTLDEVGFFDYALTEAQVQSLYPVATVGTDPSSIGYGYDGYGEVDDNLIPAAIPAGIILEPIRRVHQSLPAPTLVDGRPT